MNVKMTMEDVIIHVSILVAVINVLVMTDINSIQIFIHALVRYYTIHIATYSAIHLYHNELIKNQNRNNLLRQSWIVFM